MKRGEEEWEELMERKKREDSRGEHHRVEEEGRKREIRAAHGTEGDWRDGLCDFTITAHRDGLTSPFSSHATVEPH